MYDSLLLFVYVVDEITAFLPRVPPSLIFNVIISYLMKTRERRINNTRKQKNTDTSLKHRLRRDCLPQPTETIRFCFPEAARNLGG